MKKTIKINLGGIIFHIDEDAYEKLKDYLNALTAKFGFLEEGDEIISDIESRIAEILQSEIKDEKQVINTLDIDKMKEIMGEPEDYYEGEQEEEPVTVKFKTGKRLYRDTDNSILGGVCSGLGTYFGIDPIWFRVLFIIMFLVYGSGLLLYLVLWIVIPKAETTAQKLEMRGENITVQNIERSVKKEYQTVKENFSKMKDSKGYQRSKDAVSDVFRGIGTVITVFLKIILMIIGISFIIAGFFTLLAFISLFLFKHTFFLPDFMDMDYFYFPDMLEIFTHGNNVIFIMITLILAIGIPLLALIYGGIKLVFRFKANDKVIGLTAFVLWLLSVISLFTISAFEGINFSEDARVKNTFQITGLPSDTLYLKINEHSIEPVESDKLYIEIENVGIYLDKTTNEIFGKPEFDIRKGDLEIIELEVQKRSKGSTYRAAVENAKNLIYNWEIKDSLLIFDPYYRLPSGEQWRIPHVKLMLNLPVGKVVYFDDSMTKIIYNINNTSDTYDHDMVDKKWIMKNEGLTQFGFNHFPVNE
ncbi:MAG: PspC domain-containing protein [Bacteroidetes bacterium]|nr:PspC domain-containing protein [Bacteroidota bacterium]